MDSVCVNAAITFVEFCEDWGSSWWWRLCSERQGAQGWSSNLYLEGCDSSRANWFGMPLSIQASVYIYVFVHIYMFNLYEFTFKAVVQKMLGLVMDPLQTH